MVLRASQSFGNAQVVPVISEWQTYTPVWATTGTQPSLGNGVLQGKYRQVGSEIEIEIRFSGGSTTTWGTGEFTFSIPSGLTMTGLNIGDDSTASPGSSVVAVDDSAGIGYGLRAIPFSSTQIGLWRNEAAATAVRVTSTAPFTWAVSDRVTINYKATILQWTGSANVAVGAGVSNTILRPSLVYQTPQISIADKITSGMSGFVVTRATAIVYMDAFGNYRMRFSVSASITAQTLNGGTLIAISGVTFKNVGGFDQPCAAFNSGTNPASYASASPGTGNVNLSAINSSLANRIACSGDVELDSKPTWAS
jgi:hypothetical protein